MPGKARTCTCRFVGVLLPKYVPGGWLGELITLQTRENFGPPDWYWHADLGWFPFMSDRGQVQTSGLPTLHANPWAWATQVSPLLRPCPLLLWPQCCFQSAVPEGSRGSCQHLYLVIPLLLTPRLTPKPCRLYRLSHNTALWAAMPITPRVFETIAQGPSDWYPLCFQLIPWPYDLPGLS